MWTKDPTTIKPNDEQPKSQRKVHRRTPSRATSTLFGILSIMLILLNSTPATNALKNNNKSLLRSRFTLQAEPPSSTPRHRTLKNERITNGPSKTAPTEAPILSPTSVPIISAPTIVEPVSPDDQKHILYALDPVVISIKTTIDIKGDRMEDFVAETRLHYHFYFQEVIADAFVQVDLEPADSVRRQRRLNSHTQIMTLQGTVTFIESLAPSKEVWKILQRDAMKDTWLNKYTNQLSGSELIPINTIPEISYSMYVDTPKESKEGYEYQEITQKKPIGGMVGGIIGAFIFLGIGAFAFVKRDKLKEVRKKRWVSASRSRTGGLKRRKDRQASMNSEDDHDTANAYVGAHNPSFPVALNRASVTRHPYPLNHSKSNLSHFQDDDDFSLGDVEALAPTPNPGEKMLNKVLALSSFSPLDSSPAILQQRGEDEESDDGDCVDESIEVSMYSFSQQYRDDLQSPQFGGRSVMVGTGFADGVATNAKHHEDDENAFMSPMSMGYPETPHLMKSLKDAGRNPDTADEEGTPSNTTSRLNSERILSPTRSVGNVEVTIDLDDTNAIQDTVNDSLEDTSSNVKRTLLVSPLCHHVKLLICKALT